MKIAFIQLSILILFIISCAKSVRQVPKELIAPVRPVTDTYHGIEILSLIHI